MLLHYSDKQLLQTFQSLPEQFQTEVWNFMQFLVFKNNMKLSTYSENNAIFSVYYIDNQLVNPKNKKIGIELGLLKGKITVPENFNEPLQDFSEYM